MKDELRGAEDTGHEDQRMVQAAKDKQPIPERIEIMIGVLSKCADYDEGAALCPYHALHKSGNDDFPECDECWTMEDNDEMDCSCCWRAFANGEPMPVAEVNANAPRYAQEWRVKKKELERQREGNPDE